MFQTCPQVHRHRAQLQLHRNHLLFVHKIYRYADNHVKTAVPVLLGLRDIILDIHYVNIILRQQSVSDQIYILYIRTDNTDPGDIINIIAGG